jgi:hypothetical protein
MARHQSEKISVDRILLNNKCAVYIRTKIEDEIVPLHGSTPHHGDVWRTEVTAPRFNLELHEGQYTSKKRTKYLWYLLRRGVGDIQSRSGCCAVDKNICPCH